MDMDLRDELEKHLSVLLRQDVISSWHDRCISPGDEIHNEIDAHLNAADIILLLVSVDFLASDYCYDIEMARAMERHTDGTARVIPVILRPCDWHGVPFGNLMATPPDGKPVVDHSSHDQGFLEVVKAIRQVVDSQRSSTQIERDSAIGGTSHPRPVQQISHSSNLRVKRTFTDHDRHAFLSESFEFIASYFEASLQELKIVNPHLTTDFRRLDARGFEAHIFTEGQERSRCGIWIDSQFGWDSMLFSSRGVNTMLGYEESISVDDDGYEPFLRAMGMPMLGQLQGKDLTHLTREEAAEYLWSLLIERLN